MLLLIARSVSSYAIPFSIYTCSVAYVDVTQMSKKAPRNSSFLLSRFVLPPGGQTWQQHQVCIARLGSVVGGKVYAGLCDGGKVRTTSCAPTAYF